MRSPIPQVDRISNRGISGYAQFVCWSPTPSESGPKRISTPSLGIDDPFREICAVGCVTSHHIYHASTPHEAAAAIVMAVIMGGQG